MKFLNILFILLIAHLFWGTAEACLCQDIPVFQDDGNFLEAGFYNTEGSLMFKVDSIDVGQLYGLPGKALRNRFAQWKVLRNVIAVNSVIPIFDRDRIFKRSQHYISACTTEFPIRI